MNQMQPAHPAALIAFTFALLLATATGSAGAAGEGSPATPLGPGAIVQDLQKEFDYFTNSWTVIGLPDLPEGTRISPQGELVLAGGTVLRPLVGEGLYPLSRKILKTLADPRLLCIRWDFTVNGSLQHTMEALACPLPPEVAGFPGNPPDNYLNLHHTVLKNLKGEPIRMLLGFAWQPERALQIQALQDPGQAAIFSGGKLLATARTPAGIRLEAKGAKIVVSADLAGGASAGITLAIPFHAIPEATAAVQGALARAGFDAAVRGQKEAWGNLLGRGAGLSIPEKKVLDTFNASLIYQFIGLDRGEIHAGEGFYDELYLRDGAYQALSLAHAGFMDEARRALEPYFRFQKDSGQFVSQEGQLDANGYSIWALVEFWRLSGDEAWLRRAWPAIQKSAAWIQQERRIEKDPASPFAGVLPKAIADGENLWAGKNHILGYDWWNLRGIQCAADAARALGEAEAAERLRREFEDYRSAILKALKRTGLPYIPPSYEKEGTHWGNLEVAFPTPLLDPRDPLVTATLREVSKDFGTADGPKGFIEGLIQWTPATGAIHPYMSQFVTNTRIIRGEATEAIDGLYSFLLHTTSTHGFPEGVYYKKREAWGNTVPHLWAAALYVTTLRNMLLREEGDDLHLLSAVPADWLGDGKSLELLQAPTRFGRASLSARRTGAKIQMRIVGPDRLSPKRIVIHAPAGLRLDDLDGGGSKASLNGDSEAVLSGELRGKTLEVVIGVRPDPGVRIPGFDARAAALAAEAPQAKPIPGLLPFPPSDIDPSKCLLLDLSAACTTDPFKAPFNVQDAPNFTGMPTGDLVVSGVPFRIVDPAKNGGKGLVVLDGDSACKGLPREFSVKADIRGRFLCSLGNVTGWGPGDPGTGPSGAVAVWEVHYAGGSIQTIPWITGRTAEDWLGSPGTGDLSVGLQGPGWHLNLLVAALEPRPVERIVLRDLGTQASPVVAALTIVR